MKKVTFSAGHGGFGVTPGKRGPDGKYEWDWNNAVVIAAMKHLTTVYGDVQVIRIDDPTGRTDPPLTTRSNSVITSTPDLHIDVHHNALGTVWIETGLGIETFVMTSMSDATATKAINKSLEAAQYIHPCIVTAMGLRDRGIKRENFHMLREINRAGIPSILTEGGFMDSRIDRAAMDQPAMLVAQGVALADGVANFLNLNKKATSVPIIYTIKGGDTLWSIANSLQGVTIEDLIGANPGINPSNLQIGQKINLPSRPPSTPPPKSISQMADEVIAGLHGNGHETRRKSLGISQTLYNQVRDEVNRRLT